MTPPEEFETILKEVVNAKRLSASKMTLLTELAMKNMEHDTQLVSILYRTHKSLPTTPSKVSSLYVFDALARAAKHHATKHGFTGDIFTQPGNSATFLLKVGGVVEGLFQDMIASGNPESKEKTKKILDIWVKGNTFPSTILSQLLDILKGTEKVPDSKATLTADPRIISQPNYAPSETFNQSAPISALDPQAALLALLTQAAASTANIPVPQIAANTMGTHTPHLDAAQLAVIQQLAHTAASVPFVSQSLNPAEPVNVQKFPSSSGVNGSSRSPPSFRDEPRKMVKSEQRYSGYRSPESDTRPKPHSDERDDMRGRYRGGFRNRGRGDRMGGNWNDRDRDHFRDSERDTSPPRTGRGGRSRSRSPSRNGDRKGARFHSPLPRPRATSRHSWQQNSSAGRATEPGKDEFGRDIRPESPSSPRVDKSPPPPLPNSPPPPKSAVVPGPSLAVTTTHDSKHDQNSVSPLITANTSSNTPNAAPGADSVSLGLGMDNFNLSTFDYTSPASWEALGKMWQVTHGYLPSTEQLMQFIVSYGTGQQAGASLETESSSQDLKQGYVPSQRGRGRGRGGSSRGRGGTVYGNGRNMYEGDREDSAQATEAIVLGGGEESDVSQYTRANVDKGFFAAEENPTAAVSSSGRMQRVGDKWLFVRGTPMDVS